MFLFQDVMTWEMEGSRQPSSKLWLDECLAIVTYQVLCWFYSRGTLLLKGRECSSEILKTILFWGRIVGVAWNVFFSPLRVTNSKHTSSSFCHSFSPKWKRSAVDLVRNQNRFLTAKMYGELLPFFLYGSVSPGFWFMEFLRITFYMTALQPKRDKFPFLRFYNV